MSRNYFVILSLLTTCSINAFFGPVHTISLLKLHSLQTGCPCFVNLLRPYPRIRGCSLLGSMFDDFEDFKSSDSSDTYSTGDLYADLRARQTSLNNSNGTLKGGSTNDNQLKKHKRQKEEDLISLSNWKNARCTSTIRLMLSDWIRRIAVESYPLAVCGSADGSIYLADLESGQELDCVHNAHLAQISDSITDLEGRYDDKDVEDKRDFSATADAMRKLYGMYDGGGVISIAVYKDTVVSSGREGGVRIFSINGEEKITFKGSRGAVSTSFKVMLSSEGMLQGMGSTLVTSMAFDDTGTLWIGGYDGFLRGYEYDNSGIPLRKQKKPIFQINTGSEILHISVNNKLGCGVAATASGKVFLFSTGDGEILAHWNPFGQWNPFEKAMDGRWKKEYATSAIIVQNDKGDQKDAIWSVVCGGSKGTMYQRILNVNSIGYVSEKRPFRSDHPVGRMQPSHSGPVVTLASPSHGLLVSGSQDGTIRVWDCSHKLTKDEEDLICLEEKDDAAYNRKRGKDKRPRCLYALTGYKAWLGSIFANKNTLASDGADNTIVVHDFSESKNDGDDMLYEGEEGDEMEGFSSD